MQSSKLVYNRLKNSYSYFKQYTALYLVGVFSSLRMDIYLHGSSDVKFYSFKRRSKEKHDS